MNTNSRMRAWLFMSTLIMSFTVVSHAEIIVKTFHDANNNGVFENSETLITGLYVQGFDTQDKAYVFSDNNAGTFSLKDVPSRMRIQVTGYNAALRQGVAGPTSVFFAEDGQTIYVPVSKERQFDSSNTSVLVPCFEKGSASNKVNSPAFVAFPYNVDGVSQEYGGTAPNPRMDATIAELGSTWGVGYQSTKNRAFISTILKRHVDLGPEGPGGIYVLDYNSNPEDPTLSSFNLEGYKPSVGPTIELGVVNRNIINGTIGDNDIYSLTSIEDLISRASFDVDAFNKVGQLAYGDIDVTEDEKQLWMVNLNQRSLISLDVASDQIKVTANKLQHYIIDELPGIPSVDFRFRRCINAGGNDNDRGAESFTDPNKLAWDRNKYSDTLSKDEYKDFAVQNEMNKDEGTSLSQLYNTWRKGRNITYDIPVPKEEKYTVILHFAEPNNYAPGDRIFDVLAEGNLIMDNFDVSAQVGIRTAMTYSFTVDVTGPTLKLDFKGEFGKKVREAFISGIEVIGESMVKSGNLRPWGLAFHNGRGYMGLVNDAMITQARDHLYGWVVSFDPNNMAAGVKEEVAFPLAYPRERTSNADYKEPQALRTSAWLPWIETWEMTHIPLDDKKNIDGGLLCSYPQPQISDINFTEDGSMVIAIMDRWAHQTGYMNYSTIAPNRNFIIGYASGDIIKAFKHDNSYVVEEYNEDNGIFYNKIDGPSYAGEFFYEDEYQAKDFAHHGELITGGAAILNGTNEVIATVHNPIETTLEHFEFNGLFTQGVHYYDTEHGHKTHAYLFVDQFNIGKANGLGDIEFALGAPTGEVGNYLWCDANANGVQDPTEFGISGVEIVLHDKENSLQIVGTVMSDANGQYLFQNLLPSHCYEIRIDLSQLQALGYSGLTAPTLMGGDTTIDSNGDNVMLPGFAVAMFCTDALANNRHDIDFGFGGPRALDAMKSECEDPITGCATFSLSTVAACVDTSGLNQVRFYPTFNDADSMLNEIIATSVNVCDVDTILFARVNVVGDVTCASIAQVTLTELNGGSVPQVFSTIVCPAPTFDATAYLTAQGINGMAAQFYSDASLMNMIANPIPTPTYPTTVYFTSTVGMAACTVTGSITIYDIPEAIIGAGNDTESCGLQCIDLTTLGASFMANGSGATAASWTSSGSGSFSDDNTFAGARFYCPDSMDMQNGSVTLTLSVTDDPCGRPTDDAVTIIIFNSEPRFIGDGASDTILCTDPFVDDQINNDTFPRCRLVANCGDTITATVIDYKTVVGNCLDIVKLVIRTQRVRYNKVDYFCTDTIRVAGLDFDNFTCPPQRDSVYCHTGYLKDENGHPSPLETGVPMAGDVPLWPQPNSKCDILILYQDVEFTGDCPMTIRRTWWVKNACNGRFDTCEQWLMIFDTIGPDIKKDFGKATIAKPGTFAGLDTVILVPTTSHDCEAYSYVPPVWVTDTCHDVKLVKAMIPGITTVNLTYNATTMQWESHEQIKIPRTETPIPVIYEAFDLCHNVTRDTCYFFVKDFTKPVTICDKGINVTISDTTVWLKAEIFDEGSWDNCGISLLLARRADWATACGVNLCDSIIPYCTTEHHDTLWCSVLEQDKHVNPIAAHYAENLRWLCEDEQDCSDFIIGGWWYDLIKHATLECIDHPYPVNDQYLKQIFNDPSLECFDEGLNIADLCSKLGYDFVSGLPEFSAPFFSQSAQTPFDIVSQIGGGWSKEVPFCCTDACQDVMVELLAMDYWCNWSKCWTTVFVEDKTPPVVVCDLFDINLSCTSYKQFYESAVLDAQQGDFTALDSLLGGYDQVQYDQYHNTPDKTPFKYYNVRCDSVLVKKDSLVYDEHLGYQWVSYQHYIKVYDTLEVPRFRGQIADDCGLVSIEKEPWISLDECGNGFIKRVFKFVGQCELNGPDHKVDTITKYQTIWIQSDCNITKSMFSIPEDVILYDCGIEYDLTGSGNAGGAAHPNLTGRPKYLFDNDCRQVGIGYYDKVFKIIGGTKGCYKILRTWCFADWCSLDGQPKQDQWWFNPKYEGKYFSWVQKIVLLDTVAPVCLIDIPDTIEAGGCFYDLDTEVTVEDQCGVLEYTWELFDKDDNRVGHATGQLNSAVSNAISVKKTDLGPGAYVLKLVVSDDCQNEGICKKEFVIEQKKKPGAVCISSLTLTLNSMDSNNDGVIDTAMGTVWASEFNQSSTAACGSLVSDLKFRLDRISDGDPTLPGASADKLEFGCADIGTHALRMYVLDPSGTWDFCEIILVVQNNGKGCGDASSTGRLTGVIANELDRIVHGVELTLSDLDGSVLAKEEVTGGFRFELSQGSRAYLTPFKDSDHLNGVSTRDLIAIQQHLLGKKKVDTWYKKQAADVNGDGIISVIDIIQLRKLILGMIDELPESTSWRFYEKSENQEQYYINPMRDLMRVDFTGVKIGDLNLDSDPSQKASRSGESLHFVVEDQYLTKGKTYQIAVQAQEFRDIAGMQFTLSFDQNKVAVNIVPEQSDLGMNFSHFNLTQLAQGWLTASWYDEQANLVTVPDGASLFFLNIKATEDVRVSDVISLNNRRTRAEAYAGTGEDLDLALVFDQSGLQTEPFTLYQNVPNPFSHSTMVAFQLPEASLATMTIYDVTGRTLKVIEGFAAKGYHEWNIDRLDLPVSGILYYKLETEKHSSVRKMILMAR